LLVYAAMLVNWHVVAYTFALVTLPDFRMHQFVFFIGNNKHIWITPVAATPAVVWVFIKLGFVTKVNALAPTTILRCFAPVPAASAVIRVNADICTHAVAYIWA